VEYVTRIVNVDLNLLYKADNVRIDTHAYLVSVSDGQPSIGVMVPVQRRRVKNAEKLIK